MATPKQDGFRMPGEFESHDRTFMTFPHRPDNWRNNAKNAQLAIANLAREISKHEEVVMIIPREHMHTAVSLLHDTKVKITAFDSDDCWTRDTGTALETDSRHEVCNECDYERQNDVTAHEVNDAAEDYCTYHVLVNVHYVVYPLRIFFIYI